MLIGIYLGALLLLNLLGYASMGHDKRLARRGRRRVPEQRLFLIAFLGGGIGSWFGMRQFRHKTKHASFRLLVPLAALVNLAVYGWLGRMLLF